MALLEAPPADAGGSFPTELLYEEEGEDSQASRLHRLDLRTGQDEVLLEAPTNAILVPPVGDYMAYVSILTEDGEEVRSGTGVEGTPVLHVRNIQTGEETVFEGVSGPEWSWDGERLFVRRVGAESPSIGTLAVDEMRVRPLELPEAIGWFPIGWADDRLLLFRRPGNVLFLASPDGTLEPAPTPDGEIRDPSPDGAYVFAESHEGDAVFQPFDGGAPSVVDLKDWIFGLTPWAGDGRVFAAVASGFEIDSPAVVLVLDPEGDSWEVPNTERAVRAFPTAEGDGFVLARGRTGAFHRLWACLPSGKCRGSPGRIRLGATLLRVG